MTAAASPAVASPSAEPAVSLPPAAARDLPEVVYTPDSDLLRPGALVRDMLADLWLGRGLAWQLFLRDIRGQYRQSLLGSLWLVIPSLVSMAVWTFLTAQGVLQVRDTGVPYPVFVLTGLVLWDTFVAALHMPLGAVSAAMGLLTKIRFPREALLLAGLGHVAFQTVIKLCLLAGVMAWYGVGGPASLLGLPLVVVLVMGLGLAVGLLIVPAGLLYHDVGRGLGAITGVWFFLTPVVYPPPQEGLARGLIWANPVAVAISATREALLCQPVSAPGLAALVAAASLIVLLVAWVFFRVAMPHVIARSSA